KRSYQELAQVLESVDETQVKGLLELATKKINEVRSKVLKDLKLQENTNLPTYWKDEVRRLIQEHEAAVRENKLFIPNDIKLNGKSLEFQAAQLISFYGKALRVWPQIIKVSIGKGT